MGGGVNGAEAGEPGWVTQVDHIWMLAPFKKVLEKRQRERVLLAQLEDCVDQLFRDPCSPGLNLETLHVVGGRPILSARITRSFRLILTPVARREVGLLYFDNHDEAYRWVDRNRDDVPKMLAKVAEVKQGQGLWAGAAPLPADDEESPLAIKSAEQFREMVAQGIARYLTWLDDDQRTLVELRSRGLMLVKGGAGTGKTVVAIHRLIKLAEQPVLVGPRKVLYLCFNRVLASTVRHLIAALRGGGDPEDVEVWTFHSWCGEFIQLTGGEGPEVDEDACRREVARAFGRLPREQRMALAGLDSAYVDEEIEQVIKHNGLRTRERYLQFNRKGRRITLKQAARAAIWDVHERASGACAARRIARYCDLPLLALDTLDRLQAEWAARAEGEEDGAEPPQYRAVVIDEAQDCTPVMVRLARRLLAESNGPLTVFVDPAQAIYECGFQWTQAELRPAGGNVRRLRKSYRTTKEIFALARPLLEGSEDLAEELAQLQEPERHGRRPVLMVAPSEAALRAKMVERIAAAAEEWPSNQIAVLATNWRALEALEQALSAAGVACQVGRSRDGAMRVDEPGAKLLTIPSAKGLDFPVVFMWGPHGRDMGGPRRAQQPEARRELYVGLTRAGAELTIGVVAGQHHPLLEYLPDCAYDLTGEVAARGGRQALRRAAPPVASG